MASIFDWYKVTLHFERDVLGTNPLDQDVLQRHIHNKQREIIMGKSKANTAIERYIDALPITKERSDEEVAAIIAKIEDIMGMPLDEDARQLIVAGKLKDLKLNIKDVSTTGTTVFFWNPEKECPMIGNHQIIGFLKEAAEAVARVSPKKDGAVPNSARHACTLLNTQVRVYEEFINASNDVLRNNDGSPAFFVRSLRVKNTSQPRVCLARSEVLPAGTSITFHLGVRKKSALTEDILRMYFDEGQVIGFGQWRGSGSRGLFNYELKAVKAPPKA